MDVCSLSTEALRGQLGLGGKFQALSGLYREMVCVCTRVSVHLAHLRVVWRLERWFRRASTGLVPKMHLTTICNLFQRI